MKQSVCKKFIKDEEGSVTILVALMMTVLMGFAALSVDIGMLYNQKREVQNAADAAALAGAMSLPNTGIAKSIAISVAEKNLLQNSSLETLTTSISPIAPYNGTSTEIEVTIKRKVKTIFAQVLGIADSEVSGRAVAKQRSAWSGQVLPFINITHDFEDPDLGDFYLWDKTGPGIFMSVDSVEWEGVGEAPNRTFKVDLDYGIVPNAGDEANTEKKEDIIAEIYSNTIYSSDKTVYALSLKRDIIIDKKVDLKNVVTDHGEVIGFGTELDKEDVPIDSKFVSVLNGKWAFKEEDIVLLELNLKYYDKKLLTVEYVNSYNIFDGEIPDAHGVMIYAASLVE